MGRKSVARRHRGQRSLIILAAPLTVICWVIVNILTLYGQTSVYVKTKIRLDPSGYLVYTRLEELNYLKELIYAVIKI